MSSEIRTRALTTGMRTLDSYSTYEADTQFVTGVSGSLKEQPFGVCEGLTTGPESFLKTVKSDP